MTHRLAATLLLLSVLAPLDGCAARGGSRINDVVPIELGEGATTVEHLAPDGRQGLVVEARDPVWRAPLLMAMLPRIPGNAPGGALANAGIGRGWDVIGIQTEGGALAASLDGRGRALVLARAKVGALPATLLFVAGPDDADPVPAGDPRRMVIRTLRLDTEQDGASFLEIGRQSTRRRFCDPREAIAVSFRLALPDTGDQDACAAAPPRS